MSGYVSIARQCDRDDRRSKIVTLAVAYAEAHARLIANDCLSDDFLIGCECDVAREALFAECRELKEVRG